MKYSWKGHNDRNRHKNKIKRSGHTQLVYVKGVNHTIPIMWRWASGGGKVGNYMSRWGWHILNIGIITESKAQEQKHKKHKAYISVKTCTQANHHENGRTLMKDHHPLTKQKNVCFQVGLLLLNCAGCIRANNNLLIQAHKTVLKRSKCPTNQKCQRIKKLLALPSYDNFFFFKLFSSHSQAKTLVTAVHLPLRSHFLWNNAGIIYK